MFEGVVKTGAKLAVHLRSESISISVGDVCRLVEIVFHTAYVAPEFGKFGSHPFLYHGVGNALPDILCRGQPGLSGLGQNVKLFCRADFQSEAVTPFLCG